MQSTPRLHNQSNYLCFYAAIPNHRSRVYTLVRGLLLESRQLPKLDNTVRIYNKKKLGKIQKIKFSFAALEDVPSSLPCPPRRRLEGVGYPQGSGVGTSSQLTCQTLALELNSRDVPNIGMLIEFTYIAIRSHVGRLYDIGPYRSHCGTAGVVPNTLWICYR